MLLPVTCSCLTMTWAMAVTCSAPAKPQHTQREGVIRKGGFFFATTVWNDKSTEPDSGFVERKVPYIEKKLG